MPWRGVTVSEQRQRFLEDYQLNYYPVTELAERFGISRKTAYPGLTARAGKWIGRFEERDVQCRSDAVLLRGRESQLVSDRSSAPSPSADRRHERRIVYRSRVPNSRARDRLGLDQTLSLILPRLSNPSADAS